MKNKDSAMYIRHLIEMEVEIHKLLEKAVQSIDQDAPEAEQNLNSVVFKAYNISHSIVVALSIPMFGYENPTTGKVKLDNKAYNAFISEFIKNIELSIKKQLEEINNQPKPLEIKK